MRKSLSSLAAAGGFVADRLRAALWALALASAVQLAGAVAEQHSPHEGARARVTISQ